jgi:hypothetical protein
MKEEYIKLRNSGQLSTLWFYRYYVDNSKDAISFDDFNHLTMYFDFNNIIEHIDNKYKLTRLYDKNNNFIKVIE